MAWVFAFATYAARRWTDGTFFRLCWMAVTADEYLARISLSRAALAGLSPAAAVTAVHAAHASAVPFENADVWLRRVPIVLDMERVLNKLVRRGRGGFCFELNGGLGWLLAQLGYDVTHISARVWRAHTGWGPVDTHVALLVRIDDGPEQGTLLVDVGNGAAFGRCPVWVRDGIVQNSDGRTFVLRRLRVGDVNAAGDPVKEVAEQATDTAATGGGMPTGTWRVYELQRRAKPADSGGPAEGTSNPGAVAPAATQEVLIFELYAAPREWASFAHMCAHHQREPGSPFLRGLVAVRLLPGGGRLALVNGSWAPGGEPSPAIHLRSGGGDGGPWVLQHRRGAPQADSEPAVSSGAGASAAVESGGDVTPEQSCAEPPVPTVTVQTLTGEAELAAALREHFGLVVEGLPSLQSQIECTSNPDSARKARRGEHRIGWSG
jgi:arylamine N-acetyltransferase